MALISKASLLMVPSTYEPGTLFNVLPSGNRAPDSTDQNSGYDQTRADFDFDRGSNAAATRINSSGLIEKYRENKLLQSNQFDTTWVPQSGITLTANQQGYDGTNDAWKFEKNASSYRNIRISVSVSGVYTTSVYAKAGTLDLLTIRDGSNQYARFYLSTGTYTLSNSPVSGSMVSVGNGWYRCSVTMTTSNPAIQIYPDWNQTNAGYIYIQNAQLESGLIATDYLDSTSVTGKAGVLVDLPRINYDANGENGSLLLEPSRANLVQFSEWFGGWNKSTSAITITQNYGISPEGVKNSSRIEFTGASQHINISTSLGVGVTSTGSVYIKGTAGETIQFDTGGAGALRTLNGDWQRIEVTSTSVSSLLLINTFNGATARDIEVYGAQVEASATYASSYIPNHGESGGVTRAADSCSVTGASDVIGQSEGTLFVEAETLENGADCRITLSDNTIYNRVSIEWDANADTIKGFIGVGGNVESTNHNQTNRNKIAIVYNSSDARFFINGTKVMTDTSVPSLSGMDRIEFSNFSGPLPFVGKVYKMYVSKEKLTDAECETLTTL